MQNNSELVFETIHQCRGCGKAKPEVFFPLGEQPPANSLRKSLDDKLANVPLTLGYCRSCSLIQLMDTIDPEYLFKDYVWVTGTSATARAYAQEFCKRVLRRLEPRAAGSGLVVEIASNDGTFLKVFQDQGLKVLGVDPAENIVREAVAAGIPTEAAFFNVEVARKIKCQSGSARAVFARNVLPHVADLHGVVQGIAELVADDGVAIVEFHSTKKILEELHYDSIYHEHLCYFSLKPLESMFAGYGLHAFDLDQSPISGGSHVIYMSRTKRPASEALQRERRAEDQVMNTWEACKKFADASHRHRGLLVEAVRKAKAEGKKVIGYGASARSSTLLNYCGLGTKDLDCVADQSPHKHYRYTPGTDLLILPPEEAMARKPGVVLLLAWNFREELMGILDKRFGFRGEVILPLPGDPRVIPV